MVWINGRSYDLDAAPAWSVPWAVRINGASVSDAMRPYLIDISVTDKEGTASDACSLTLDNGEDRLDLDCDGRDIEVYLDGAPVFTGVVESVRCQGSRGGGRTAIVAAKGFDVRGKAKQPLAFHKDEASLKDFLGDAARRAGYTLEIDPALGDLQRDYWSADYESFLDLGEKFAREINGTFKLRGKKAVLVRRGTTRMTIVEGRAGPGGNVISYDLAPFSGRPAFTSAEARWFDRRKAVWKKQSLDIALPRQVPDAANVVRMPVADEDQAKLRAGGRVGEAGRDSGGGTVEMDIAVTAQAEAVFMLSGAGRDVDGPWRIVSVTHKASRDGGATTSLELKEPGAR